MRETVRFLFGDTEIALRDLDPTATVLDWLRLDRRLTGTKEGCAEGDCGACTVLVGEPAEAGMRYQAVNACIRFLATLDGCRLLTVEHLKRPDGSLNPPQQAMVDCHGSQCGFCTPGFVMSLQALYLSDPAPSRDAITDALAGNLCRCTGYAPIIAAARRMYELEAPGADPLLRDAVATAVRLKTLRDEETVATGADGRRFLAPATLDALAGILEAEPDATIVAGATDVGLWVTKFQRQLPSVVYLGRVAALKTIAETDEGLEIGAGVTYSEAEAAIALLFPDFATLIRRIGARPVRNVGTIGGNIANGSPIGDTPPALIALGAEIVLRRGAVERRIALEDFFIAYGKQDRQPGEFVLRIVIPWLGPSTQFRAYKLAKRFDQDISAVCGAFAIDLAGGLVTRARLAFGGMAGVPKRAATAEAALVGQPWTRASVEAAMAAMAADFAPLSDWRASAGYRAKTAANMLLRCFIETTEPHTETRLVGARNPAHA
jgi:xanthine dehydrogenase small subunit